MSLETYISANNKKWKTKKMLFRFAYHIYIYIYILYIYNNLITQYAFLSVNINKQQLNDETFKIQLYFESYKSSTFIYIYI